ASAFASARPYASGSCSSARPQTTWAFGGAHRSRKSHLRRDASSSDTSRSGSACASGIPGEPPPEPTSTMGPSKPRTRSSARSASSTSISRASASFRSAVSPGVARTAESQSRSDSSAVADPWRGSGGTGRFPQLVTSARDDDDVAVGLRALGASLDAGALLQREMHDLALDRRHRLEVGGLAARADLLRRAQRERLEGCTPPLAIPGCIDDDFLALLAAPVRDRVEEVLDGVDRLPVTADQKPRVGRRARRGERLLVFAHVHTRLDAERTGDAHHQPAHLGCRVALVDRRRRDGVRGQQGDHARRGIADAEQAALALGDDLELHRGLVQPGMAQLELAQRRPLRLADRLAGRLDGHVGHRLRAVPFFRRTLRGCPAGRDGLAFGSPEAEGFAPLPPPSSFGGVRDVRLKRSGGGVFGISRRVISPWPTVHRFVVTQYRTSPAGKRAMTNTNTSGMNMKRIRCVLSAVADMYSVDAIWLATYTTSNTYPPQCDVV